MNIKYLIAFILFSFSIYEDDTSANEMYKLFIKFEQVLYKSKDDAQKLLQELENVEKGSGSETIKFHVFTSKLLYLDFYGSPKQYIDEFSNKTQLVLNNSGYIVPFIFKFLVKSYDLGDTNNMELGKRLLRDNIFKETSALYYKLFNLHIKFNASEYNDLISTCNLHCKVNEYYLLQLEYLYNSGNYDLAASLALDIFQKLTNEEHAGRRELFERILLAYISIGAKIEGDLSGYSSLAEDALREIDHRGNTHKKIQCIIDMRSSCDLIINSQNQN